jgi:hypothetical protein
MNRQKRLLILLLGLFALALVYAFRAMPRQTRVAAPASPSTSAPRPSAAVAPEAPAARTRVQLELLVREKESSPGFKRNIFRFRQAAPAPPPPMPKVVLPPPPPPPVIEEVMPVATERQRELARFTFRGFLLKDGVRSIFLAAGEELFVVRKGERFGSNGRFLVTEITAERLTIRQDDDPRPITVSLVEQAPLAEAPSLSPRQGPPGGGGPQSRRRSPPFELPVHGPPPIEPPPPVEPVPEQWMPVEPPPAEPMLPPQEAAPKEDPNG